MQDPAALACTCISSLVLTLTEDPLLRAETLKELQCIPALELETGTGPWVAAVLESHEPEEVIARIEALSGVRFVEVIFVEVADTDFKETPTL